jgi:creatinine amidohydrolase/Fe(II)-dependent formamide hydrolase-like protein
MHRYNFTFFTDVTLIENLTGRFCAVPPVFPYIHLQSFVMFPGVVTSPVHNFTNLLYAVLASICIRVYHNFANCFVINEHPTNGPAP